MKPRRIAMALPGGLILALLVPSPVSGRSARPTVERDVQYAAPEGEVLRLDAYLPAGKGPHPGLILIHGGGWRGGDKSADTKMAMYFQQQGFAVFAVDYRLAPAFPYPAALDDVATAVRWVREQASRFRVDPREIGAVGESAGGHLAAMLATTGEGSLATGSRVRAAASWSGPMDLVSLLRTHVQGIVAGFLACRPDDCMSLATEASPIVNVDSSDAALFLANSTSELIPLQQATDMARALESASVPYQLVEVPGTGHSKAYADTGVSVDGVQETVLQATSIFLHHWLSAPRSSVTATPSSGLADSAGSPPSPSPRSQAYAARRHASWLPWIVVTTSILVLGVLVGFIYRGRTKRPPETPLAL